MKVNPPQEKKSVLLQRVSALAGILQVFPQRVSEYLFKYILTDMTYHPCLTLVVSDRVGQKKKSSLWFDLRAPSDAVQFLRPGIFQTLRHEIELADIMIISLGEDADCDEFFLEYRNTKRNLLPDILTVVRQGLGFSCAEILPQMESIVPHLNLKDSFMVGFSFKKLKLSRLEVAWNIKKDFFHKTQRKWGELPLNGLQLSRKFRAECSWVFTENHPAEIRIGRMLETEVARRRLTTLEKPFYDYIYHQFSASALERLEPYLRTGWVARQFLGNKLVQTNINICLRCP